MFSVNGCVVINWSKNGDVQGVVLKSLGKAVLVLAAVEKKYNSGEVLAERIQSAYDDLAPNRDAQVVLTGYIERGAYLDIKLPNLSGSELHRMLEFELARRVPYPVEDLVWQHEVVDEVCDSMGRIVVRVFITPESDWNEIISHLRVSGVKADLFIPVFMSEHGSKMCYLPSINEDFILSSPQSGGVSSFIVSSDLNCAVGSSIEMVEPGEFATIIKQGAFEPALLCGVHVLEHPVKIHNTLMSLPADVQPQRLRGIRSALIVLLAVTLALVTTYAVQIYLGNSALIWAHEDELDFVQRRQEKLSKTRARVSAVVNKIEAISGQYYGDDKLVEHLAELTEALPNEMRLTNLSLRENEIDLSIVTERYTDSALEKLEKSAAFEVMSVKKRTLRGVTAVDVTLHMRGKKL